MKPVNPMTMKMPIANKKMAPKPMLNGKKIPFKAIVPKGKVEPATKKGIVVKVKMNKKPAKKC